MKKILAAMLPVLAFVALSAEPVQASVSPRLTNLSTSNHNLSFKTTSGTLLSLKPGASFSGARSFYASCSGTTVVAINSGPPTTVTPCTWRTMSDGSSYVVKTWW